MMDGRDDRRTLSERERVREREHKIKVVGTEALQIMNRLIQCSTRLTREEIIVGQT